MSYIGTTEIGGMFLGSTEIEKAYLGSTLVYEKAGEIPGSLITDYVQDGLILHLDGKKKGGTTAWYNQAGSGSFTNYGATFNSDHVYFDGVDDYLRSTSYNTSFFPARASGTIEVVYDNENFGTSMGVILIGRSNNKIAAAVTAGKYFEYFCDNTSSRAYICPIVTLAKASVSVSSVRRYENGVSMSMSSDKMYLSGINSSYNYIGRRNSGNYFKGKIYSIRVYNKQLTQNEVLQNLAVDNLRFNLGLTL